MNNRFRHCTVTLAVMFLLLPLSTVSAQQPNQPWMNKSLSPDERADMVLKQLTLDEKISTCCTAMAWRMSRNGRCP